jgi:O-antigen ligase
MIAVLTDANGEPPEIADFATAAANLAQSHGDIIDIYEVWDEPNLGTSWGGTPNPTEYAALLSAAYDAIHSHDANAVVLSGALAPTLETGPANISDLLFLDSLYRLDVRHFSDGIAAKPYGFDDSPHAPADPQQLNFNRILLLRDIMLRHDDARTPLWASEWGWNSLPADWSDDPSIWGSVSTEQQIAYTRDALQLTADRYPWLAGMALSHWQPAAQSTDNARWGFALLDQADQPSPLLGSLVGDAERPNAAPIGLHRPDNPYARYTGVWTFGELGADIGWVGDSSLEFTFRGDALSLLVREGNYTAYLYMTIDGKPANALPSDADGNTYLLLTSDTLTSDVRLVPVARNLGDGVHTVRLVADRGWDQWALVGFAVGDTDLAEPFDRQIALAIFSSVLSSIFLIYAASQLPWSSVRVRLRALLRALSDITALVLALAAAILMTAGLLLTWREGAPDIFRREPIQLGLALLTGGLLYLNPAFVTSLAAAVVLFVIFFHKPLIGLTLVLLFAPFFLFPIELYRFAFPMSELLILITFSAWVLRTAVNWARRRRDIGVQAGVHINGHLIDVALVAYLLLGILSLAWTEYGALALTEIRTLFVEPLLFYIILRTSRPEQRDILRLVDALVASAVLVAVIGLFLFVQGNAIITAEDGARRLASVYGSPNNVALWLGRALPFALVMALLPLDRKRRWVMAGVSVLLLATITLTLSAGAFFLGIPAAMIVVLILVYRRRSLFPLVGLAAMGALALPLLAQFPRFTRLLEPTDGTNFFRIRVWQSAIAMIRDHPITGIGQDQFLSLFQGRYILPDAWQEPSLSHPHNFVFDIWLRLGIGGLVWLLVAIVLVLRSLLRSYARLRQSENHLAYTAICIGCIGAFANTFAHGLIDNSLFVNDLIYVWVLGCGIAVWGEQQF